MVKHTNLRNDGAKAGGKTLFHTAMAQAHANVGRRVVRAYVVGDVVHTAPVPPKPLDECTELEKALTRMLMTDEHARRHVEGVCEIEERMSDDQEF